MLELIDAERQEQVADKDNETPRASRELLPRKAPDDSSSGVQ